MRPLLLLLLAVTPAWALDFEWPPIAPTVESRQRDIETQQDRQRWELNEQQDRLQQQQRQLDEQQDQLRRLERERED